MIKFQGLADSDLFVNLIKLEMNLCFFMYCIIYAILRDKFYRKIDNIVPTFKQLSPLQGKDKLKT